MAITPASANLFCHPFLIDSSYRCKRFCRTTVPHAECVRLPVEVSAPTHASIASQPIICRFSKLFHKPG